MRKFLKSLVFTSLCSWQVGHAAAELPVASKIDMVVSEQQLASQVGADILRAGGNAIDAAVAVGYTLAVVEPCCGNIGGGGFMTLHMPGDRKIFINFRERAPLASTTNMYLDKNGVFQPQKSTIGYLAVATPGTVLGLDTALTKYGTMTRQQVMAPAIKLARQGYILQPGDIKILTLGTALFERSPNVKKIFLNKGRPFRAGEKFIQTDLANTLQLISDKGTDVFYKGKIAQAIVSASQKNGGILSLKDFNEYTVEIMRPLNCSYRGFTILSSPPPSSGGVTLCEILHILDGYPLASYPYHSAKATHYVVEAMRFAFADRNNQLGDPDFVSNPIEQLTDPNYAALIRKKIPDDKAVKSSSIKIITTEKEGVNTTQYSVMDKFGNAVSVTVTLNAFFGAQVIAGDTGFFLNDEMDDFTAKPNTPNKFGLIEGEKNKIEPGKRPLSSMSPTIILQGQQPILILGSPGGPRIITSVLETILNIFDYHLNLKAAIDAPRYHQQWWPEAIDVEPNAFTPEVTKQLTASGYQFTPLPGWGAVESIYIDPQTKILYGANDRRRQAGAAVGH
jgi:gamma-glutamyltranspeptidase/glutathione hydrolase